jgi:ribosomal protein S18 acetylase RimI-like enzyme
VLSTSLSREEGGTAAAIDLRPATLEDDQFAYHVHRAAMRPSVEEIYGWDEAWQEHYFQEHFDPAKRQIIRYGGVDVGVFSVEEREDSLFLALIALLPQYQCRGIGTTLIRGLQQRARDSGLPVTLRVLKANRARELYERLGFVLAGETKTHHQMRWVAEEQRRSDNLQTPTRDA